MNLLAKMNHIVIIQIIQVHTHIIQMKNKNKINNN